MLRTVDFHGLKAVEFSKGDYTALLVPGMGANLVRLANTRLGAGDPAYARSRRDRGVQGPSAGVRSADSASRPTASPTGVTPSRAAPTSTPSLSRRSTITTTGAQKRGFHRLEGQRNDRGGDGRVPLPPMRVTTPFSAIFRTSSNARSPTGSRPTGWSRRMFSNRSKLRMPVGVGFHTRCRFRRRRRRGLRDALPSASRSNLTSATSRRAASCRCRSNSPSCARAARSPSATLSKRASR